MLRNWQQNVAALGLVVSSAVWAWAQTSPLEIQQLQVQQELDRQVRREAEQHQAQLDEMRRIEWQSVRDQHRLDSERRAQETAQQQYSIQKMQQQLTAKQSVQMKEQDQPQRRTEVQPLQQAAFASEQPAPVGTPRWSYSNINDRDKVGLTALGMLLLALAFPAGLARFRPWRH